MAVNVSGLGSVDLDAVFLDGKITGNVIGCSIWAELQRRKWEWGKSFVFFSYR